MSVFSQISKKLGFQGPQVPMPTFEQARELSEKVFNDDRQAFEEVFRIYRFAGVEDFVRDIEISDIIFVAFVYGRETWSRVEDAVYG